MAYICAEMKTLNKIHHHYLNTLVSVGADVIL